MKKVWKPYMVKKFTYDLVSKLILGLIVLFLWDRLANTGSHLSILGSGAFIVGFVLFVIGWINYLRLDGVRLMPKGRKKSREDLFEVDLLKEDILTEKESLRIKMLSSFLASLVFVVPSILHSIFV